MIIAINGKEQGQTQIVAPRKIIFPEAPLLAVVFVNVKQVLTETGEIPDTFLLDDCFPIIVCLICQFGKITKRLSKPQILTLRINEFPRAGKLERNMTDKGN